jgi:hypothetical protein
LRRARGLAAAFAVFGLFWGAWASSLPAVKSRGGASPCRRRPLFGAAGRLGGEGCRGAAISTAAVLGYPGFLAGPPLFGAVAAASSLRDGFLFLYAAAVLLAACAPALRRFSGESES